MDKPSGLSKVFATWVLQQQMVWSLPLDKQGQSWGKESCLSGNNRMLEPELPPSSSGPQDTNKKTKTQKEEITLPRSHGSRNNTSCSHLLSTYYISYCYISILLILVLPKTTFQGREGDRNPLTCHPKAWGLVSILNEQCFQPAGNQFLNRHLEITHGNQGAPHRNEALRKQLWERGYKWGSEKAICRKCTLCIVIGFFFSFLLFWFLLWKWGWPKIFWE